MQNNRMSSAELVHHLVAELPAVSTRIYMRYERGQKMIDITVTFYDSTWLKRRQVRRQFETARKQHILSKSGLPLCPSTRYVTIVDPAATLGHHMHEAHFMFLVTESDWPVFQVADGYRMVPEPPVQWVSADTILSIAEPEHRAA